MGLFPLARRYTKTQTAAVGEKTPLFCRPFIRYRSSTSGYLHGGQRQTVSDYHWLLWEMKNALVNSSRTALFVSVGTEPNSEPLTWNAVPLFFLSGQFCSGREEEYSEKKS